LLLTVCSVRGAVLHVRADAAGLETNGISWVTAFGSITQALKSASSGDELWVATGTYRGPIQVPAGVALFGGFAGDETARTQRNWERNRSVIDWDEWMDIYPFGYYQFYPAVSLGNDSRLDGFSVINGWSSYGAGVYASESGATIANSIIVTNRSTGIFGSALLVDRSGQFEADADFFLKTANDLLRIQFPFAATNIPVVAYGPTVHRLLQVAANVYDVARSNAFPSVFRPRFASTTDGVIISGYYQDDSAATVDEWLSTNPYGIPMIIAARKGFPNFNEIALETGIFVARQLELHRMNTNMPPYQTNEMYLIGISNLVAVEAWNSYTQAFQGPLEIVVANHLTTALSNSEGLNMVKHEFLTSSNVLAFWPGFSRPSSPGSSLSLPSFRIPLYTNVITLSNSVYRFTPVPHLEDITATNTFVVNSGFKTPDWQLSISNNLVLIIAQTNRIIDFVQLRDLTNYINLMKELFRNTSQLLAWEGIVSKCWSTNRYGSSIFSLTEGIQAQIDISLGNPGIGIQEWTRFSLDTTDKDAGIASFRQFVFPQYNTNNTNLVQRAPFTPARKLVLSATWQVNDPLVHALPEHLKDITNNFSMVFVLPFGGELGSNHTIGRLNSRYSPWRGSPLKQPRPEDVDPTIKDWGITKPNNFNFPSGPAVNVGWLDRIHRGTPWQTLYFDRAAAPARVWEEQFLDPVSHPTNDWRIIEYLRSRLTYSDAPSPTRVLNNTMVGNSGGGLWIATNASAIVMNNAIAYNSSGLVNEGSDFAELSRNCVFGNETHNIGDLLGSPQFAPGSFSVLATSPLIDAGNSIALGWIQRNVLGASVDIGAFEFGPDGMPVFTLKRTVEGECEIELRGYAGQSYVIEASTNLTSWDAISTNVAELGALIFRDSHATNFSHRFYRARTEN
jgi:uncharacterized protein DUF1565